MLPQPTAGTGQDAPPRDSSLKDINDPAQRRARGRPAYLDAAKRISAIIDSAWSGGPFKLGTHSDHSALSPEQPAWSWAATELNEHDEDERFALPGSYPVFRPEEPHPPTPRAVRRAPVDEPLEKPMRQTPIDEPFEQPARQALVDEPFEEPVPRTPIDEPLEEPVRKTLVDKPFEESGSEEGSGPEPLRIKTNASIQDQVRRVPGSERTDTPPDRRSPSLPRAAGPPPPADSPLIARPNRSSSTEQTQELFFSDQRKPEPFAPASPRFQLEQGYADPDAPLAKTSTFPPSIPPPRRDSGFSSGSRLRSPVDSLASQTAEWIEAPRSPDGLGLERSIPTLSRSNGRRRRKDDASRMEENSEGPHRRDSHPQTKETGTGYYRLYSPSGPLFSINPIYENDISLSSFSVEDVQSPHSPRNYIAYIARREGIKPSGIKMYLTVSGTSPELVSTLDMSGGPKYCGQSRQSPFLIYVEPNNESFGRAYPSQSRLTSLPYRDLNNELPRAYYRLFGVAPSATGAQRPMPSHDPLYEDDLSLSALFIDYVPPPLRAKDYIAFIAEREQIHPSRVTLYLSANVKGAPGGVSMAAEAQEVKNLEEILASETASSTSERYPIMVNVQLEVGDDGALRFGTKHTPLRLSMKARVKKLVALSKYARFDEPFVSYPDLADGESGTRGWRHQGIQIQQSNRGRYDEDDDDDDGLPTMTVVSENYHTSPSLPSRGGPAAPGPRRDSSFSSGGTGKYDEPYSPSREGSNWSSAEEGGVKVM